MYEPVFTSEKKVFQIKLQKNKFLNTKYHIFFISILINKVLTKNFMVEIDLSWEAKIQGTSKFDYLGGFKIEVELIQVDKKVNLLYPKPHKLDSAGELTYGLTIN